MKKLLKKALTISLCVCMMTVMATAASAADMPIGQSTTITTAGPPQYKLNMWVSNVNSIQNLTNVTANISYVADGTQNWIVKRLSTGQYVIEPYLNQLYSLNINQYAGGNCTLYKLASNSGNDCYITMLAYGSSGDRTYSMKLDAHNKYLVVNNDAVYSGGILYGYNVLWGSDSDGTINDASLINWKF